MDRKAEAARKTKETDTNKAPKKKTLIFFTPRTYACAALIFIKEDLLLNLLTKRSRMKPETNCSNNRRIVVFIITP